MAKVTVRKKEKEPEKKKKRDFLPVLQVMVSLVTAIVAVCGILLSYQTFLLNAEEKIAQREAAVAAQERQELADRNNRFTYAIEHLKDESLAIRMGALFELKKLGLEDKELQEGIVRILNPFIREGIENEDLLHTVGRRNGPNEYWGLLEPNDDIFLACEITSMFFRSTGCIISLQALQAENRHLQGIDLSGADLSNAIFEEAWIDHANLEGADLFGANLERAMLTDTNLKGTNLWCAELKEAHLEYANLEEADFKSANLDEASLVWANLKGATLCRANLEGANLLGASLQGVDFTGVEGLTVEQLRYTWIDDTTLLDHDLANDPRIQARIKECKIILEEEQDATPE